MARRGRPSQVEGWADQVSMLIPIQANPFDALVPAPKYVIANLANLTEGQVAQAVAYIRDNHPDLPLVSSKDGYVFTYNPTAIRAYNQQTVKGAMTRIKRDFDGVMEPYLKKVAHPEADRIARQFHRLLEDLTDIL